MGLETGTYISDLVATNPAANDPKSQGDDHIRLLKATIKSTFPNVAGPVNFTAGQANYLVGVTGPIQTQIDGKGALSGNNVWTGTQTFNGPISISTLAVSTQATLPTQTNIGAIGYSQLGYLSNVSSDIQGQFNSISANLQGLVNAAVVSWAGQYQSGAPWSTLSAGEPLYVGDVVSQAGDGKLYWASLTDATRPVNLTGATALATAIWSYAGNASGSNFCVQELPNGNIVVAYSVTGAAPRFVVLNSSGVVVVTETSLPGGSGDGPAGIAALGTDGKFVILSGNSGTYYASSYSSAGVSIAGVSYSNTYSQGACRLSDGSVSIFRSVRNSDTAVTLFNATTGAASSVSLITHASDNNPTAYQSPIVSGGFNIYYQNTSSGNLELRKYSNAGAIQGGAVSVGANGTIGLLCTLRDGKAFAASGTTGRLINNSGAISWTATLPLTSGVFAALDSADGVFVFSKNFTPAEVCHVDTAGTPSAKLTLSAGSSGTAHQVAVINNGKMAVAMGNPTYRNLIDMSMTVISSDASGSGYSGEFSGASMLDAFGSNVTANDTTSMLGVYDIQGTSIKKLHAIGNRSVEGVALSAATNRGGSCNVQIGGYATTRISGWNATFDARSYAIPGQKGSILGNTATLQGLS